MVIFTEPAPTPIQSISCNGHYKDKASKPLCPLMVGACGDDDGGCSALDDGTLGGYDDGRGRGSGRCDEGPLVQLLHNMQALNASMHAVYYITLGPNNKPSFASSTGGNHCSGLFLLTGHWSFGRDGKCWNLLAKRSLNMVNSLKLY